MQKKNNPFNRALKTRLGATRLPLPLSSYYALNMACRIIMYRYWVAHAMIYFHCSFLNYESILIVDAAKTWYTPTLGHSFSKAKLCGICDDSLLLLIVWIRVHVNFIQSETKEPPILFLGLSQASFKEFIELLKIIFLKLNQWGSLVWNFLNYGQIQRNL